ncbi:MAG: hypothetical protein GX242_05335 [Clostridiales bacterium]|nr:hypothetical protein [Clostridiales bacterium]
MAKKSEFNSVPTKSIDEMSDIEFITSADYLASPYYRAYVSARARMESQFDQPRNTENVKTKGKAQKPAYTGGAIKGAVYSKKRSICHILIAVFMLVTLTVALLSFLNIDGVEPYSAVFVKSGVNEDTNTYVGLLDPIFGLVKKVAKVNVDSFYFDSYVSNMSPETDIMTKISLYAVPVAALLIVICAIIGFFKSIVALVSKRYANGYYKKYKFGFLSIVMLLSALVLLVGGMFASGADISVILDFILGKTTNLNAGYGVYALILLPILTFILSCVSYKKA